MNSYSIVREVDSGADLDREIAIIGYAPAQSADEGSSSSQTAEH